MPASTDRTITDPEILEAVLAECREVGWTSEFEENEMGGVCVAAPIFDPHGEVVAAVSIAGPAARFTKETIARLGQLLVGHLAEITAEISGGPHSPSDSSPDRPGNRMTRRRILLAGIFPLNPPWRPE